MKLKKTFIVQQVGGEQFVVPVGASAKSFHGFIRNNETAAYIVECLKKETTPEAIINNMLEEYEIDRETLERDVNAIIDKLRSVEAIEE